MSVEPPAELLAVAQNASSFAILRAKWLDSFARLELAVCQALKKHGKLSAGNKPFGHRLAEFSKLLINLDLPGEQAIALKAMEPECEPLLRIRADMVHSIMATGHRGREPVAFFHNVADRAAANPHCLVMTSKDFDRTEKQLRAWAARARL